MLLFLGPALLGVSVAAKVLSSAILLVTSVTKIAAAVQGVFAGAALGTRIGVLALAAGTKIAAAAQWLLNTAVAAFPVVLIIAAIAGAVYAIYRFRAEIAGFLEAVWGKVTDVFGAIAGFLKEWGPRLLLLAFPPALVAAVLFKFRHEIWDAITGIFERVGGFFADLGRTFYDAGRNLIMALVDGIVAMAKTPYDAVKEALGFVGDLLPFSDAKEGPLSRLTESGFKIMATLAEGVINAGGADLAAAVARILPDPLSLTAPLPVGPVPVSAPAGTGTGGRGPVSITLHIERVEIIADGADASEVAAEFVGEVRKMVRSVAEEFDSPIDA